jgi:hypothetical protein
MSQVTPPEVSGHRLTESEKSCPLHRQTDRQTDTQTHRHTDTPTDDFLVNTYNIPFRIKHGKTIVSENTSSVIFMSAIVMTESWLVYSDDLLPYCVPKLRCVLVTPPNFVCPCNNPPNFIEIFLFLFFFSVGTVHGDRQNEKIEESSRRSTHAQ